MAYSYLDDGTCLLDDDSPLSSFALRTLRDNYAAFQANRRYQSGWAAVDGYPWKMWGLGPTAHGPFWVYTADPVTTITVRIRYSAVREQTVRLYATVSKNDAGSVHPPPKITGDWAADDAGASQAATGSPGSIELVADARGQRGWLGVWIWTDSLIATTDTATGSVVSPGPNRLGAVCDDDTLVGVSIANPPEYAIYAARGIGGKPSAGHQGEAPRLLCYCDDADDTLFALRPGLGDVSAAGLFSGGDAVWATRELGVIDVVAVSLRADMPAIGLSADLTCGDEPARFQVALQLAAGVAGLVARRVPTWLCSPGQPTVATLALADVRPWRLISTDDLTTTYQAATTPVLVPAAIADSNGYRAILQMFAVSLGWSTLQLTMRLAAYTPLGALIVAGDGVPVRVRATTAEIGSEVTPLANTALALFTGDANTTLDWAGRGKLWGYLEDPSTDARALNYSPEALLAETSITYPCLLVIEIKKTTNTQNAGHLIVAGAGIASRTLDEEMPP